MDALFLNKYQPFFFKDFETDPEMLDILNTLISMNNLNVLFIGSIGSGKTAFLNAVIREYYKGLTPTEYVENILHINSLKEQGINYYRNDVKTFCQTCSSVKGKKKIIVLDDIDFINEQSQQVFRNCIDKYSHNVHFISSCSNSQKVIEGYSVMDNLDNYFVFVKITKMLTEVQKYNIIPFICKYITVFHNIHEDEIELALFSNNLHQIIAH